NTHQEEIQGRAFMPTKNSPQQIMSCRAKATTYKKQYKSTYCRLRLYSPHQAYNALTTTSFAGMTQQAERNLPEEIKLRD
ncbi:MAG: hypothetical protein ACTJGG_12240, partial [Marinomonas foliarum]